MHITIETMDNGELVLNLDNMFLNKHQESLKEAAEFSYFPVPSQPIYYVYFSGGGGAMTYRISEKEYKRIKEILRVFNGEILKEITDKITNERIQKEFKKCSNSILRLDI